MAQTLYWLHALTPLHVGAGFGLGFIDLPIIREKITKWPIVPGSAVKGVMAERHAATAAARENNAALRAAFGRAGDENANSGSLVFADARTVCLAVPSLRGTFAWATSPLALRRLRRDMQEAGVAALPPEPWDVPNEEAHVPSQQGNPPAGSALKTAQGEVFLGELDLTAQEKPEARQWAATLAEAVFPGDAAWQAEFVKRFVVLGGDTFDFLCKTATEVNARVHIDDQKKTVKKGQLWYEEYLPAESILAGLVWCDKVYNAPGVTEEHLLTQFCSETTTLQIGGKATTGKGRVRFVTALRQAAAGGVQ
jgi:CRISPR-associated protein Cmr4